MSWDELAALHAAPLSGRADANAKDGSGAWPDEECLWLLGATFDELMRVGELNFEEKACFLARFRRCGANAAAAGFVLRRLWSCVPERWSTARSVASRARHALYTHMNIGGWTTQLAGSSARRCSAEPRRSK